MLPLTVRAGRGADVAAESSLADSASEVGGASSPSSPSSLPKPLLAGRVPEFLERYGFQASTSMDWRGPPPEMSIQVHGHHVSNGHTVYHVHCALSLCGPQGLSEVGGEGRSPRPFLSWRSERRLGDLRAGLHHPVSKALGSSYGTYFCGVRFAHRMRPSGTTARLDAWCRRLAYCINAKLVPPAIAAETLRVLSAPEVEAGGAAAAKRVEEKVGGHSETACGHSLGDAGDSGSTCTGGESSVLGVDGEDSPPVVVSSGVRSPLAGAAPSQAGPQAPESAEPLGVATDLAPPHMPLAGGAGDAASAPPSKKAEEEGGFAAGVFGALVTDMFEVAPLCTPWEGGGDCEDDETSDEEDLTDEVLRSGLPGLGD